jgi:hypothetical protein
MQVMLSQRRSRASKNNWLLWFFMTRSMLFCTATHTQVASRLEHLQQQEQRLCMDQQLARLQQQQAALQAELSQLAETLTSSKQANVVARAKVAAATSETTAELQSAQVGMALGCCTHAVQHGECCLPVCWLAQVLRVGWC